MGPQDKDLWPEAPLPSPWPSSSLCIITTTTIILITTTIVITTASYMYRVFNVHQAAVRKVLPGGKKKLNYSPHCADENNWP